MAIKILHCKGAKMEGNGGPLGILHCEGLVSSTKIHCKCSFSSTDIYLDVCRNFALQGYSFKSYDLLVAAGICNARLCLPIISLRCLVSNTYLVLVIYEHTHTGYP